MMKFSTWFLVGLGAFVVFVLSCELVSRAEVDTGTPSPAVAVPNVCESALERRVRLAVNEWCSCGGRGPDDEAACSACHVLHMVFEGEVS
jgi:hypothetical protein